MPRRRLTPAEQIASKERKRLRKLERRREKRAEHASYVSMCLSTASESDVIDVDVWGVLVDTWNELSADERDAARAHCARIGHHPVAIRGKQMTICSRCRRYA